VFYKEDGEYIILKIKAQPQASRSEFCGLYGEDAIKVRVAAPAVEGAANKELTKFLAKQFKVPKSSQSSKVKLIKIPKSEKLSNYIEGLKNGR